MYDVKVKYKISFKICMVKNYSQVDFISLFTDYGCIQDPIVRPLVEQDTKALQRMLPEIPLWVKNPDFDRV